MGIDSLMTRWFVMRSIWLLSMLTRKLIYGNGYLVNWKVLLVLLSFVPQIVLGRPDRDGFGTWHGFGPPNVIQEGEKYDIWWERGVETLNGLAGKYRHFIQRIEDEDPIAFYESGIGIASHVSHNRKLVLIYDRGKSNVRVVDLETNDVWNVEKDVLESHRDSSPADWYDQIWWITEPLAFSPDDDAILLCRYVSHMLRKPDVLKRLDNIPKNSFYVVETRTGRILKRYKKDEIPKSWLLK